MTIKNRWFVLICSMMIVVALFITGIMLVAAQCGRVPTGVVNVCYRSYWNGYSAWIVYEIQHELLYDPETRRQISQYGPFLSGYEMNNCLWMCN